MPQPNDLSRSLVALDQNSTIIAVIEMSQSSWLVAGMLPGIERQPCKKLEPSPERLLGLLHGWQDEAVRAGRTSTRIAVAVQAGRDGFWLARWLAARGARAHVSHAPRVAVSREPRRGGASRPAGAALCSQPDQRTRGSSPATFRAPTGVRAPRHGSAAGPKRRCWRRNG